MTINQAGLNLIKSFEKCILRVYLDQVGLETVGFGHRTSLPVGRGITAEDAEKLLLEDLRRFEACVNEGLTCAVGENEFSAMVAFAFNVGARAFTNSTLLKLVNLGKIREAAAQFDRWCMAGGKPSLGLQRRRAAEKALFLS